MEKLPDTDKSYVLSNLTGLLLLSGWGTVVAFGLSWALNKAYTKLFILLLLALAGCASSPSSNPGCDYSKWKVAKLQKRAAAGDAESQFQIAWFHSHGTCLSLSKTTALDWYQKAADQGHIGAQLLIGSSHYSGLFGLSKNRALAAKWFERAAEQGNRDAQYEIAVLNQWGVGVTRSVPTAKQWYEKAASQHHPLAEQRICQLTPECYTKSPRRAAVVLNALHQRLQREEAERQRREHERQLALAAKRTRLAELLGTVVVKAHAFDGDVRINKPASKRTVAVINGATIVALTPIWTLSYLVGALLAGGVPGMGLFPTQGYLEGGLSPKQNKLAKKLRKQLHTSIDELQPTEILQHAIAGLSVFNFDNPFFLHQTTTDLSKNLDKRAHHNPDTTITILDASIDFRTKPFSSNSSSVAGHNYSFKMRAKIKVTSMKKKRHLLDTDWYEHTISNLNLRYLTSPSKPNLENVINAACQGIANQLFNKFYDDAV